MTQALPDYHCVRTPDDVWHLTQEQAAPPAVWKPGAWTVCGPWASLKQGYEQRRPTCPVCLREAERYEEARRVPDSSPAG